MSQDSDDGEQVALYHPDDFPIGTCAQLFQDMQLEKNRFVVMAKLRPSSGEEAAATASTETELCLTDKEAQKEFRFHKVFGPSEDNATVFDYLKFYSDCVIQGEDCNVLAYGGRGSGKSHTLFGTPDEEGLLYLYIQQMKDTIQERGLSATLSVSLVSVDDSDTPRDLLKPEGPSVWKIKFSHDRYDSNLRNIYKAELLDTSELERIPAEDPVELKSQISSALQFRSGRSRCTSYIVTVYFDGEDELLETHGRLTLVELISSDWMKKSGSIEKTKSAFHDVMKSLFERRLVSYQQGYLTYILRDQLCLGVRTALIATIDSSMKRLTSTANTISFTADLDLDYDLGAPVARVISKQYEYDHAMLLRLVKELEGKNQCMIETLKACLTGERGERRKHAQLMSEEVQMKKQLWAKQQVALKREIKALEDEVAANRSKYESSDAQRREIANKIAILEDEFNRRKTAARGQSGYIPLGTEYEMVKKEHTALSQKREEYKQKLATLSQKLEEFRATYPNFNETGARSLRARKAGSKKRLVGTKRGSKTSPKKAGASKK